MKQFIFNISIAILCLMSTKLSAQISAFDGTSFSFIAKDSLGQLITSQNANLQINLRANSATGTPLYIESQAIPIPADGVVSGILGQGTVASISPAHQLSDIDWAAQDVFLELILDGTAQGTMQFYSVPYAQVARKADSANVAYTATIAQMVLDKEIVVVTQTNHQTVVVNDNDIVKLDTVINISANYTPLQKNNLYIVGGGFTGTGFNISDPSVLLANNTTITGASFKNVRLNGHIFINCTFEDVAITGHHSHQFIGCTFSGTINLTSKGIINNSIINNATFPSISRQFESIQNTEISYSNFTTIIHSLENNFIRGSTFNDVWRVTNNEIRSNSTITVRSVFSGNNCSSSSINTYNDNNAYLDPIVISGNTFSSNNTSPFIRVNISTSFDYLNVIIANNIFTANQSLSEHIDFRGSHTAPDEGNIQILGNTFRRGSRAFVSTSGNISMIVKNNVTMGLSHPVPIGVLTSTTSPIRIVTGNHIL